MIGANNKQRAAVCLSFKANKSSVNLHTFEMDVQWLEAFEM